MKTPTKSVGKNLTHYTGMKRSRYRDLDGYLTQCTVNVNIQIDSQQPLRVIKALKVIKSLGGDRLSFGKADFKYDDVGRIICYNYQYKEKGEVISHKRVQLEYSDKGDVIYYRDLRGNEWSPEWGIENPFSSYIKGVNNTKSSIMREVGKMNVAAIQRGLVELKGFPDGKLFYTKGYEL
jgi:hypothetical protein